ncbi:MAG: hypothetical protein AAF546_13355, partial [Verrucomicrobiota bacterium]
MKNASLLVHDISYLVTMDIEKRVLQDAWVWIEDGDIKAIGEGALPEELPADVPLEPLGGSVHLEVVAIRCRGLLQVEPGLLS